MPEVAVAASSLSHVRNAALVGGFAVLTAIAAQISVPLPETPVPMTLQTLPVLMAAALLGAGRGTASMGLYVLLGLVGVPVFAGGEGGVQIVFGATWGYLLGFIVAQPVMGWVVARGASEGGRLCWRSVVPALVVGHAIIWTLGLLWLWIVTSDGLATVLAYGLWPFVPGDVVKIALAALALSAYGRFASTDPAR